MRPLLNARLKLEAIVSTDGYGEIYYYAGTAGQASCCLHYLSGLWRRRGAAGRDCGLLPDQPAGSDDVRPATICSATGGTNQASPRRNAALLEDNLDIALMHGKALEAAGLYDERYKLQRVQDWMDEQVKDELRRWIRAGRLGWNVSYDKGCPHTGCPFEDHLTVRPTDRIAPDSNPHSYVRHRAFQDRRACDSASSVR